MKRHENGEYHTGASIRRTVAIGEFETVTIELPIDITLPPDEQVLECIVRVNAAAVSYINAIFAARQANTGKGALEKLIHETYIAMNELNKIQGRADSNEQPIKP